MIEHESAIGIASFCCDALVRRLLEAERTLASQPRAFTPQQCAAGENVPGKQEVSRPAPNDVNRQKDGAVRIGAVRLIEDQVDMSSQRWLGEYVATPLTHDLLRRSIV